LELADADLSDSNFISCNFIGANIKGANFSRARLVNCVMKNADLESSNWDRSFLSNVDLAGANLANCRAFDVGVEGALTMPVGWMACPEVDYATPGELAYSYVFAGPEADLSNRDLTGYGLSGADLEGAKLAGADLRGVYAGGVSGTPASLPEGWVLRNGYFFGPGTTPRRYLRSGLTVVGTATANLDGIDLSGLDLSGSNFLGCSLQGANLSRADLSGADLTGSDLRGADFRGAVHLDEADFRGADLTGVHLPDGYSVVDGVLVAPAAPPSFRAWARENGLPDAVVANDRGASGHPLLLHFALDVAPNAAIPVSRLPRMTRDATNGDPVFRYPVPKGDHGLVMTPQVSTNPAAGWSPATALKVEEDARDQHYEVTVPTGGSGFFRLQIEYK
jgi:uncharacterized protein YjbI with pentapeptide repeats